MTKMRWEKVAAKREVAEAAIRKAIEHIESARQIGGPLVYGKGTYTRALMLIREAESALRQSEGA